jgi:hypothetical protein
MSTQINLNSVKSTITNSTYHSLQQHGTFFFTYPQLQYLVFSNPCILISGELLIIYIAWIDRVYSEDVELGV